MLQGFFKIVVKPKANTFEQPGDPTATSQSRSLAWVENMRLLLHPGRRLHPSHSIQQGQQPQLPQLPQLPQTMMMKTTTQRQDASWRPSCDQPCFWERLPQPHLRRLERVSKHVICNYRLRGIIVIMSFRYFARGAQQPSPAACFDAGYRPNSAEFCQLSRIILSNPQCNPHYFENNSLKSAFYVLFRK